MTKHNHPVAFGRRVVGCPRCEELEAGAPARKGWGQRQREQDQQRSRAIAAHQCSLATCGQVCTRFDW